MARNHATLIFQKLPKTVCPVERIASAMYKKIQRILALAGATFLSGLYLITLILAFVDPTEAKNWLKAAIVCTVILPVFLYAYILVYRNLKK